jgi:hypothetical protein
MTTKADTNDDSKQEVATPQSQSQSQSPPTTTAAAAAAAAVESTPTNSETESADVDELAQAVGQIHVSSSEVDVDVDESKPTTKDEPEEVPEALRKVASWIMDGTVKNIVVLTGAGVRYVLLCYVLCDVMCCVMLCLCIEERLIVVCVCTESLGGLILGVAICTRRS